MHPSTLTTEQLAKMHFRIEPVTQGTIIEGVRCRPLEVHMDGRGEVTELWSAPWMEHDNLVRCEHVYQSATDFGVIKAWHLHATHTDQFVVTRGKIQIVCADVRQNSKTHGVVHSFVLGLHRPMLLLIPPGILHGWKGLSIPEVIVMNFQSHPFDPRDEYRFPWDSILADIWEPRNG